MHMPTSSPRTGSLPARGGAAASAEDLALALEQYLAIHPGATVVEEGAVLFDLSRARYAVEATNGRCVLQLWSEQRNLVRTVLSFEQRKDGVRLQVTRFGQARATALRLVPAQEQRTRFARETGRTRYVRLLERVLSRAFADWKLGDLLASADLEHSFGPAYVRGTLERGQAAFALVAINADETPSSVDGIVAVALLWLEHCRQRAGGRRLVEGVKVVVPAGRAQTVRARMAWLNPAAAKWELWEFDEPIEELLLSPIEVQGNSDVRLSSAFREEEAMARCRGGVDRLMALLPEGARPCVECKARTPTEVSLRLHGLEFARVEHGLAKDSFAREDRVSFGAGPSETLLHEGTEALFCQLTGELFAGRRPEGNVRNPLFRLQPERWLESRLRHEVAEMEPQLCADPVYSQVPAMASSDRGMLDLLTVTRGGRLAVLELKASEDLHLPFQGLDYWMRVRALHRAGEFVRSGYFQGIELSQAAPLLYFVVPALRLHSTFDVLMKQISPEVEWRLIALDERWRKHLRVIFRKHGGTGKPAAGQREATLSAG